MPKSLDPARAAAPPETDLVRAVFEGLTELDPRTLEPMPAVAEKWIASEDRKTWDFYIRPDARWSNGNPVTAEDFVRSWKRLAQLGEAVAHHDLLTNIVGFPVTQPETPSPAPKLVPDLTERPPDALPSLQNGTSHNSNSLSPERGPAPETLGVSAPDPATLRVTLITPDKDFPKLVAHPIFRPVFGNGDEFDGDPLSAAIVCNGAFRVSSVDDGGVTLERSETYWDRESVKLELVRFVTTANAEAALSAYKAGDLDAITNADFEPLALKLLEPFDDFRRRTHAAVNFYEINHEKPPFDDRRVREALAMGIERERLTEGEMEGRTQPALSFLPYSTSTEAKITQDKEKAMDLLAEAGFPNGENFPVIRLVVNRNDTQQRIARSVARMWKQNLNLETDIVVIENDQLEAARDSGEFDLVRRGVVFPTADEMMSILAVLKPARSETSSQTSPSASPLPGVEAADPQAAVRPNAAGPRSAVEYPDVTMSEANAVYELWAIPLYFPTSYSLVKPYVFGFEMNSLDAPLLRQISIDSDWQPK